MELWALPPGGAWASAGPTQTGASGAFTYQPTTQGTYSFATRCQWTGTPPANKVVSTAYSAPLVKRVTKYYALGAKRVAMRADNVVYYLHGDHLGSTSLVTCGSSGGCNGTPYQGVVSRQWYDPYGSLRGQVGASPTDVGYTAQKNVASINLLFYRARFYSSSLGRFLSADTIVPGAAAGAGGGAATLGYDSKSRLTPLTTNLGEFAPQIGNENREIAEYGWFFQWDKKIREEHNVPMGPANPQSLNRYAYCLNNPIRYVDPLGHWGIPVLEGDYSPEEVQRLIKALDTLSDLAFAKAALESTTALGIFIAKSLRIEVPAILTPVSLALITGISIEAATTVFAFAALVALVAAANSVATLYDLDTLRHTLTDLDADDYGATITWETIGVMDRITVKTQKGEISRVQFRFGPYGSHAAQLYWLWAAVDCYSHGGSFVLRR